jgi:hypothetical protein
VRYFKKASTIATKTAPTSAATPIIAPVESIVPESALMGCILGGSVVLATGAVVDENPVSESTIYREPVPLSSPHAPTTTMLLSMAMEPPK